MVYNPVEKETVMAHDNKATFEVGKIILKHSEGHNVKVVGRFVEDKEIRTAHQDCGQIKPTTLAPAELVDIFLLGGRREQEMRKELRSGKTCLFVEHHLLSYLAHSVYHLLLLVETGHPFLTVISPPDGLADVEMPCIRLQTAKKELDER